MPSWTLASADHTLAVELVAGDSGSLDGTLTCVGKSYPVSGGWSASGSVPGRNYSVFSLSGRTQTLPDVPDWIAAVGVMTGPGVAPEKIDLRVTVSSSSDGTLRQYSGVLSSHGMLDAVAPVIADFRGAYRTSIEALGIHNPSLSPLTIYDDGTVFIADTEVNVQFDGISKVTLPAFNINGMDILSGGLTFISDGESVRFQGDLTFRDTPWMTRPYIGTALVSFPKPTLENSIDATLAFDNRDEMRLQAPNDKWVMAVGGVVTATATTKPDNWLAVMMTDTGVAISDNGKFWAAVDGVLHASTTSISQATIFTPFLTLEGAPLLKSADGKYVSLRADNTLILVSATSLDAVAQFGGEVQPVVSSELMARWNVPDVAAGFSQCDIDMASLCWQLTGGFFLALGLGPYMAESTDPKKLGIMGILRSSPVVWAKVMAVWEGLSNNVAPSVTVAAGLAAEVLAVAWHAGMLWKLIKFALTQAGWWLLFQLFSWILSWVLVPELALTELLASFLVWATGLINTAVAISRDCGHSFLLAAPATSAGTPLRGGASVAAAPVAAALPTAPATGPEVADPEQTDLTI